LTEFANASNYMGSNDIRYEIPQLDGPAGTSGGARAVYRLASTAIAAAAAAVVVSFM
jgi:hypothetical protein